jgi:hypothetical protein
MKKILTKRTMLVSKYAKQQKIVQTRAYWDKCRSIKLALDEEQDMGFHPGASSKLR